MLPDAHNLQNEREHDDENESPHVSILFMARAGAAYLWRIYH